MIYIGIDPGLTGAIGVLNPNGSFRNAIDIPVKIKGTGKGKVKNEIDCKELVELLRVFTNSHPCIALIESQQVIPAIPVFDPKTKKMETRKPGAATTFSLGDTYGAIRCSMYGAGLDHEFVTPQKWKKRYGLTRGKKDLALNTAISLWPNAPLTHERHHNRAEALLLANYLFEMRRSQAA